MNEPSPRSRPDESRGPGAQDSPTRLSDGDTDLQIPRPAVDFPGADAEAEAEADALDELGSTRVVGDSEAAPIPPEAVSKPVALADFELLRKLGEGAMGAVYHARQISFGRDVALKVLFAHVARNPKLVERLYREARAMAQLDHPGIVQAYAVGEDQNCHYVAMEYVEGQNLQKWLAKLGRLSVADAVHIALACARALAYAHGQGMVHRDIKPENVLVTRSGAVKIADLGMVKSFDDDMALTQTGHAVGTPWYMPLEQAKNAKDTDGRSDIYALGCTLYSMLTGGPPFAGATIVEVIRAKEQGTFAPARATNPAVPERLDLILVKMTAKLPRYRYQTCEEVVRDLEALGLAGETLTLLPAGTPHPESGEPRPSDEVVTHLSKVEDAPDPDVWYVRLKGPGGQAVLRKYTTAQLQKKLTDGSIDPRVKASHSAKDGFRALATYREFEGTALSRASKAAADKSTVRYRNLYKKIEEQDRRREESARQPAGAWPPWLGTVLTIGGIVLAVVLVGIFLYWVGSNLGR
jgi:serine/threonine protein kinase